VPEKERGKKKRGCLHAFRQKKADRLIAVRQFAVRRDDFGRGGKVPRISRGKKEGKPAPLRPRDDGNKKEILGRGEKHR